MRRGGTNSRLERLRKAVKPPGPFDLTGPPPPEELALLGAVEDYLRENPEGMPLKDHPETYPDLIDLSAPAALRKLGLPEDEVERLTAEYEDKLRDFLYEEE